MTVRELIVSAYRWANIIAERAEEVDSTELSRGLEELNRIIRGIDIDGKEISLISEEVFDLTVDQNEVLLPGWVDLLKVQYNLGNVRYDIKLLDLNDYLESSRIENSSGIPYIGYKQRTPSGITFKVFFRPSQTYQGTFTGYKSLTEVTIDQELTDILDFTKDYLMYELATVLPVFYQRKAPLEIYRLRDRYKKKLMYIRPSRNDMVMNYLGRSNQSSNLGDLNLGRGYRP